MEKKIKKEMLLEMIDYALKHDVEGMRELQNELILVWNNWGCVGCKYGVVETNDCDGIERLFYEYSPYEIVEITANGVYSKRKYITILNGRLITFDKFEDYFDKEFVVHILLDKEEHINLNDFFCLTCGENGYYDYCEIFIKHYLRFNAETTKRKVRDAIVDTFTDWNKFLYYSWDELNDNVRSSTKEDVFDDMRNILKDRKDKMMWFPANDSDCVLRQYYYGKIEPMAIVSVRLVKDLQGNDMILQDADYCEDGSPCVERVIDNVMHLNFKEMQELYNLMEKF